MSRPNPLGDFDVVTGPPAPARPIPAMPAPAPSPATPEPKRKERGTRTSGQPARPAA